MRSIAFVVLSGLLLLVLTGCWDKAELTEFGYVQAVAIDRNASGKFELTTLFYVPSAGSETQKPTRKGITIKTQGDTIFDALRDISSQFGRKAKWDHMRIILLGEQLLRKQSAGEVLDFFSRDHEPRATVLMLVAEGQAGEYLTVKPFIEYTIGQQLRKMEKIAAKYSANTSRVPLFDLAIQLKSETGIATVPFAQLEKAAKTVTLAGVAVLKEGKVGFILTPAETQSLLMLTNQYEEGILEFPCPGKPDSPTDKESFEVFSLDTSVNPVIQHNEAAVDVRIKIKGSVGELRCSALMSREEGEQFEERIAKQVERDLQKTIARLQKEKTDALGIGNRIFRTNPALWKRWKPAWPDHFAAIRFHVAVEVRVLNTGMNIGTPFGKKGG
ncbi:Ger(x)C family spore germination protein [Paenibacillus hodogayensis]|uniref:Ger(X)C family spore germination protein n=1 Tax=Paenibacillus hodogayensis TaxID=279208 RepID=A0ABV5W3A2_9BACL